MEHVILLIVLVLLVAGGVAIAVRRASKRDSLDNHPLRGTTRRYRE